MKPLMTHVVGGYPSLDDTRKILDHMIERKVTAIEIQIPFSDPVADGPVLMQANDHAMKAGMYRQNVLELLQATDFKDTNGLIMCYYQSLFYDDMTTFVTNALEAGCKGFIVPDLPFDSSDMRDLLRDIPELRHCFVPVVSPGMDDARLVGLQQTLDPRMIYVTARKGITGSETVFGDELSRLTDRLRELFPKSQLAIGFGIKSSQDVQAARRFGDIAVVGSALTAAYEKSYDEFVALMDELTRDV